MKFAVRILIIVSIAFSAFAGNLVRNRLDFKAYVSTHRARVVKLGMAVPKLFPEQYGRLSPKLLEHFLKLHDQAKLHSLISSKLYDYYGVDLLSLPEDKKIEFKNLIDSLNDLDRKRGENFFAVYRDEVLKQNHGLTLEETMTQMRQIEKMADLVDRGMDPVASEDFGRQLKAASVFLKDPQEKMVAEALEKHYDDIVEGSTFNDKNNSSVKLCSAVYSL